ncbi:hypothetical protein CVT25_001144 [Psilocybe cyanescens]|uniref:AsqO/PenF-like C-terminal domain-containing protein n=1 Tax=Psilocybe cyanescens TaxID=93625 RepID=A0A409XAZ8_PSICY|nr:hypothetical protein CVT25_001144 [Psilocybe cyanescens]
MFGKAFLLSAIALLAPLIASAADVANWEGPHIDVSPDNRAIDWWYTQVVAQKAAPNGNTFQFGTSNTPLYSVEVNGFDLDGLPFAQTLTFNTSVVAATGNGLETKGTWGNNEIGFVANSDLKIFTVTLNTANVSGTIVINSESSFRTGCGGTKVTDSPFFDQLVSDGRPLTAAEVILYRKTGWRITAPELSTKFLTGIHPAGSSTVNVVFGGKQITFSGAGYKDSNWGPNAMNDFIKSWYVLIAQVGPWSFVTFSGSTIDGTNAINSGHISFNGQFVSSQCNIIGERKKDISIITPSGEATEAGVVVPTAFDLTFVLPNSKNVTFHATNIDVNPSVSVYHRWVAKYTGGAVGEKQYESFGITEWMNPSRTAHWPTIP